MAGYEELFRRHFISIPALGRRLKLGDLYDYNSATILTDARLSWGCAKLTTSTRIETRWEQRFELNCEDEFSNNNRARSIGFNSHTQMNLVAGLVVGDSSACTSYLKDRPEPGLVTCTIICRAKTREENLDLPTLISQEVPHVESDDEVNVPHVVTSIFYGAQVYCVLAQEFNKDETDEYVRQEVVQKLSNLAKEWRDALSEFQSVVEFVKRFDSDEKHLITRIKCRLYADLQPEPVIQCDFYDSYRQSLALMKSVYSIPKDGEIIETIPISVQLCPLQALVDPAGGVQTRVKYFDDGKKSVEQWCRIFAELRRAIARAEKILRDNARSAISNDLKKFIGLIVTYQQLLQTELGNRVRRSRTNLDSVLRVGDLANAAENHPQFNPQRLEECLDLIEAELDMIDSMSAKATICANLYSCYNQLDGATSNSCNRMYSLELLVPPLDSHHYVILQTMETCTGEPSTLFNRMYWRLSNTSQPWYLVQKKRKAVLDKILEFASYVRKNINFCNQVRFIVCHHENRNNKVNCSYVVHDNVARRRYDIDRLPDPPTGLRIRFPSRDAKRMKMSMTSIRVKWNYEDLGFPCTFLVEYRRKGSFDPWIQLRTTKPEEMKLTVTYKTELVLEIRVTAVTCVGRSEFSQVIYTDSLVEEEVAEDQRPQPIEKNQEAVALLPPIGLKVKSTTRNSAELQWSFSSAICNDFCFRVDYWQEGEDYANRQWKTFQCDDPSYLLDGLEAETTYLTTISTTTEDGLIWSAPSDAVVFTTAGNYRFPETLMMRSKKIRSENGMDVYSVPLAKQNGLWPITTERFVFGQADGGRGRGKHRTILLIGDSTSGKADVIDSMINYIFNVHSENPFRFQLTDPSGGDNQSDVTVYEINSAKGMRIDYSLTIIDTLSYADGDPVRNQEITETIRRFFDVTGGIQQVDMIGFVLDSSLPSLMPIQLYIYCSLMTIFGNKIKENVHFVLNYAERLEPSLLRAITESGLVTGQAQHHKLNSSSVLLCTENFQKFFSSLSVTSTEATSVSKQALDEKRRLKATLGALKERMETDVSAFQDLRKTKENLKYYWSYCDEFQVKETVAQKRILPLGQYVNNCLECQITCRDVLDPSLPEEARICLVCPGKCSWNDHEVKTFKWDYVQEEKTTNSAAIRVKYEAKLRRRLTKQEVVQMMNVDIGVRKKKLLELIHTVLRCLNRLTEIDKNLNGNSKLHCQKFCQRIVTVLHYLRSVERRDNWTDFAKRIDALKSLQRAVCARNDVVSHEIQEFWSFQEESLQFFEVNTSDEGDEEESEQEDSDFNDESDGEYSDESD